MKKGVLLQLFADHADALNTFEDVTTFDTATWLTQYSDIDAKRVYPLLQLAQAVKSVLIPVPPPASFRSELRQQLEQSSLVTITQRSKNRVIWLIAAVVGSILSIAGLVLLILRWLKVLPPEQPSEPMTTAV